MQFLCAICTIKKIIKIIIIVPQISKNNFNKPRKNGTMILKKVNKNKKRIRIRKKNDKILKPIIYIVTY